MNKLQIQPQLKQLLIWLLKIVASLIFTLAVSGTEAVKVNLYGSYIINLSNDFEYLVLFILSILLLKQFQLQKEKRLLIVSTIGGVLLAISYVAGIYCHYDNNLFSNIGRIFLLLFQIAGISVVTIPLFIFLLKGIEKLQKKIENQQKNLEVAKKVTPVPHFFFYWGILVLCNLPMFLHTWPVNFIYDAKYQMVEVISGYYKIHHPIIHTYLMGLAYQFGQKIGNVSLGMSLYTILQILILNAVFAYTITYLYKKQLPKFFRILALVFYGILPLNPMFAVSATKDVLFAAFFLLFVVLIVENYEGDRQFSLLRSLLLILTGCLMLLFRKNALYAFYVAIPFLVFFMKGWKRKTQIGLLIFGILLSFQFGNQFFIDLTQAVDNGSRRESLSVPLQQLARVASYHKTEMPEDLYQEFTLYVSEADIACYNPYNSDPVKNNANETLLRSNFSNFLKLWFKVGLQFPGEYLESFLTNTMGYWYLGDTQYLVGDAIASYHTEIGMGDEIIKKDYSKTLGKVYDYLFYDLKYREIPLFSLLFNPALYFWLMMIYTCSSIYQKKYRQFIPMVYVLAYFLTCLLGPLVALRYVYCVVVTSPLVVKKLFL